MHRCFVPVKVRVQFGAQLPGIQREDQRLLHGVFLNFVFHRFLPVLLILLSGRQTMLRPPYTISPLLRRNAQPALFIFVALDLTKSCLLQICFQCSVPVSYTHLVLPAAVHQQKPVWR